MLIILLPFVLVGCGGQAEPQVGDQLVMDEFKKVTVTADVTVYPDESQITYSGTGMATCLGSGTIAADFYFAPGGGDPIDSEAYLVLTNYRCYAYGNATECIATPLDDSYEKIPLEVSGYLHYQAEEVRDSNGELMSIADVLDFYVKTLPSKSLQVVMECGGDPGTISDPSLMIQIALPFAQEVWNLSVEEESVRTLSRTGTELQMNLADILITTTSSRGNFVQ